MIYVQVDSFKKTALPKRESSLRLRNSKVSYPYGKNGTESKVVEQSSVVTTVDYRLNESINHYSTIDTKIKVNARNVLTVPYRYTIIRCRTS